MTSLRTGSSETGFSVEARNRFLSQLKPVPVHSVDRPLEHKTHNIYIYTKYIPTEVLPSSTISVGLALNGNRTTRSVPFH